ncbi:MAG TPA: 5'-3' exonuclease H3TH domain-containing protein [Fimbriimonadaceae bacterium]|nr:5'-3' exonuclease H3TH domain-containing protein [Fimbriimonadaceae bacterium]
MGGAPLLIVDGDNLAHRAYHSTPKTVRGAEDRPINAIVGFFSMLTRIWQEEHPRGIFVAWDTLGVDTYRSKLWPAYQTGRVFDPEIVEQLELLPALCKACGMGVGKQPGAEADDLMASAARAEVEAGGSCLVLTTDRDAYQLVSDQVTVLAPKRGQRELERVDCREVVARLGVLPEQVPAFKALSGDSSDRIPGLPGVGPKSAASLLLKHGTLQRVLEQWARPEEVRLAETFYEIVLMRGDLAADLPQVQPNWSEGADTLEQIGAAGLAARLRNL